MITRLRLSNFKAFQDAELDINNLNLLTGLNGMGKSSLIQALLLLRQSDAASNAKENGLILKGGREGLVDLGKGKDVYNISAKDEYIRFELDFEYTPFLDLAFRPEAGNDILELETNYDNIFGGKMDLALFTDRFCYLKAERTGPEHIYRANVSAVRKHGFLGYRGENAPFYIAINRLEPLKLKQVAHPNAAADNLIENLNAWLSDITTGAHVNSTYYPELDIVKVGYSYDMGKDITAEFSPVNVGYGFSYVLPVLTAVLAAEPGDLLIIENPESHLHPRGQARLGHLFAKAADAGVQLFIESHSDHLLNGIRVAVKKGDISNEKVSVFYFERGDNSEEHYTKISQPEIDADGRLSHLPKGFFDEYASQLDFLIKE